MLCPRCGNILDESETSCKNCGAKVKDFETVNEVDQSVEMEQNDVAQVDSQANVEIYHSEGFIQAEQPEYDQDIQPEFEQVVQPEMEAVQYQEQYVSEPQGLVISKNNERVNNKVLLIAIVLIVVVSVAIGGLMIKKASGTGAENLKAITDNESRNMDSGKISSATPIEMYGYKLTIPANYETRTDNLMVYSVDYKNKVQLVFTIMRNVSYEELLNAPDSFKSDLQTLGFDVESYSELRVEDRRWLVYSGTLNEKDASYDALYAVTSMGVDGSTFHVTIINVGVKTKNSVFVELGGILDKAEYTGKNINGASGGNVINPDSGNNNGNNSGTNPGNGSGGSANAGNEPSEASGNGQETDPGSVSA